MRSQYKIDYELAVSWCSVLCFLHLTMLFMGFNVQNDNYVLKIVACTGVNMCEVFIDHLSIYEI